MNKILLAEEASHYLADDINHCRRFVFLRQNGKVGRRLYLLRQALVLDSILVHHPSEVQSRNGGP